MKPSIRSALIGHSGFVGSTLLSGGVFTDTYNSTNIENISGESFDEIVCAGVSAAKWLANRNPAADKAGIDRLLNALGSAHARRFTLISTIDVYPDPSQPLDESANLGGIQNHAYGTHRLEIERFVTDRFEDVLIVRLPALFGRGLKKNMIFDLLTGNQTEKINPSSSFQWYPLTRLKDDLYSARQAKLRLVNLFPEPLESRVIIGELFPSARTALASEPAARYDVRTMFGTAFGGAGGYIMSSFDVMRALSGFVEDAAAHPADVLTL